MPFTIAHTAAVLPFSRWLRFRYLLSAALIGSMTPDFGMFLPVRLVRMETHGFLPLVRFVLPMGLAIFWIFQLVIKPALIAVLPERAYAVARQHAVPAPIRSVQAWAMAAVGITAGALTHLAWDAFTHEGGRGMRLFPRLDEWTVMAAGHRVAGPRLLQDVSSLVGLGIIACWIAWALRRPAPANAEARPLGPAERAAWTGVYALTAVAIWAPATYLLHDVENSRLGLASVTNDFAVAGLRGLGASLLAVSLILNTRLRR